MRGIVGASHCVSAAVCQNEIRPEKVLARLCSCCQSTDEAAFSGRSAVSAEPSSSVPLRLCILLVCRMFPSNFRAEITQKQLVSTEVTNYAGPADSRVLLHSYWKSRVEQAKAHAVRDDP